MVVVIKTCLAKKMNSVSSTDMRALPFFFSLKFSNTFQLKSLSFPARSNRTEELMA